MGSIPITRFTAGCSVTISYAQIAQSVEQRTENPRVAGSIPALGILYARVAQLVEHDLAKVGVAGSSPVSRFFSAFISLIFELNSICSARYYSIRNREEDACRTSSSLFLYIRAEPLAQSPFFCFAQYRIKEKDRQTDQNDQHSQELLCGNRFI